MNSIIARSKLSTCSVASLDFKARPFWQMDIIRTAFITTAAEPWYQLNYALISGDCLMAEVQLFEHTFPLHIPLF